MSWWGKVLGGSFGFILGGPLGALMGAALGHNFDKGLKGFEQDPQATREDNERVQMAFFTATFSVMGCVAKADGQVSKDEIRHAEAVMSQMQLNPEMRKTAINLFNAGKTDGFDLDSVIDQFREEGGRRTNLFRMFMEIQIQAAYADGTMDPQERVVLLHISKKLGFPEFVFRQLESLILAGMGRNSGQQQGGYSGQQSSAPKNLTLNEAYSVLAVDAQASKPEVKKSYRRMISQHHPDKLVAKGLPEEMIKLANEKTAKISEAYDIIKAAKGW